MSGLILQFAYDYTDDNRTKLNNYKDMKSLAAYLQKLSTVELFATYAENHGLKRRNLLIQKSHKLLERYINSRIIYNMMSEQAWTEYLNGDDPVIQQTLRLFKEGKAFPKNEEENKQQKVARAAFDYKGTHARITMTAHA